jgi:hypothetical protein
MPALNDPIPYDRVAELIGTAEPSRQSTVLHDAWSDYAAKAARPYAWKTFALYARQQLMQSGDWSSKRGKDMFAFPTSLISHASYREPEESWRSVRQYARS